MASTDQAPSLSTRDLTIRFGGHVAVNAVTATFYPGTLTVIVGPNGAGKTTYFNLVSGQLPATSGSVLLDGQDVTEAGAARRTRLGIGRAFQLTNLFPNLTVMENVRLAVQSRAGLGMNMFSVWFGHKELIERAEHYLERVAMSAKREARVGSLSHGDQRKLEVAILLALEPRILMFDEPTAGMSVDEVPVVLDLIQQVKAERQQDRDFELALVAVRQHAHPGVALARHRHPLEIVFGARDHLPMSGPQREHGQAYAGPALHRQAHVFQHRQVRKQVRQLEGAADAEPGAPRRAKAGNVLAVHQHAPGRGLQLARHQVEIGGLAGAVRPHDHGECAGIKIGRHGVHRDVAAEADAQVAGGQRWLHGGARRRFHVSACS